MIRRAFTMRLKPDSFAEYKYHHDNIWPELVAEIARCGIARITTFQRGLDLFLISEIEDEAAWDRLWNSEVHKRWAEIMEPLMHLRDDGIVDAGELVEIFHLTADFPANESNGDINYVLGEATDEELADDMKGDQLAAEIVNDPLAELIADTAAEHSPQPPSLDPARPIKGRAGRKLATRTRSLKKSKRNNVKRRTAPSKTKKKRVAKKSTRKKSTPSKTFVRKAAKKKTAKNRARK